MLNFIASDHAGYDLKSELKTFLESTGHAVEDVGTHERSAVDYPDIASALAAKIQDAEKNNQPAKGILICGSGVGVSVAANKFPGIRAGLCHDSYSARQGVEHDDMNVLVLGARIIGTELAKVLVMNFLQAEFSNEPRHVRRLEKVIAIENRNCKTE